MSKDIWKEYGVLLKLGAPVLVTQLGVITVSFIDTMMVGAYGTRELAAAALVNSIYVIPIVMLIGFAGGITPLIGALFSKADDRGIGRTLRAALGINVLVAAAFTVLLGALYFALDFFRQPVEIMPLAKTYYLVILASMVPMAIFNSLQQTSNGITDTVSPMIAIIVGNVLNVAGNWVLIFGHCGFPELGLLGAGLSTLFARVVSMSIMVMIFIFRGRYRRYHRGLLEAGNLRLIRLTIWRTSYPVMLQSGVECFLWTFGTIVCGWFGKIQLAGYQIVNTMAQLGFMTYLSFATATSIRVANKKGLDDIRGIKTTALAGIHLNFLLATLASLVFLLWGGRILHLFTPDEDVIASGMTLIIPLILYQYGDAIQYTYANALRGMSCVKPLAVVAVISYLVVGMPVLYLLAVPFGMESVGVFYSFSVALFMAATLFYMVFRRNVKTVCR